MSRSAELIMTRPSQREEIQRIVARFGSVPATKITLRGIPASCRNQLMSWCENTAWTACSDWRVIKGAEIFEAQMACRDSSNEQTGKPARVFSRVQLWAKKTKKGGWDAERRVVSKASNRWEKKSALRGDFATGEAWAAQAFV